MLFFRELPERVRRPEGARRVGSRGQFLRLETPEKRFGPARHRAKQRARRRENRVVTWL